MSHRREQKEALRREREERERQARAAKQRKKLVGYGAGGLLALAVIVVLVVLATGGGGGGGTDAEAAEVFPDSGSFPEQKLFDVAPAAKAAGCTTPLHRCSIYGNKEAGKRIDAMMKMGASQPWPDALEALTGQRQMDASAMAEYFQPLKEWLDRQNAGKKSVW